MVDGCPPGIAISVDAIQQDLDCRKPGQSRFTTQRREEDQGRESSRACRGRARDRWAEDHRHPDPRPRMIENTDQRSKDYSGIAEKYRPGHADNT